MRIEDLLYHPIWRGFRERRLSEAKNLFDAKTLRQRLGYAVEEDASSRFADVEQGDSFAAERVQARRSRTRLIECFIERIDENCWHKILPVQSYALMRETRHASLAVARMKR